MSGVLPRSEGCVDEFVATSGPLVGRKSSGAKVGCMGSTVFVVDGPMEDFPYFEAIPNSDRQSDSAKPDVSLKLVSLPLLVFEFSDMICHHKLFGKNLFSPLSELGSNSKEDDMLLLDWVNYMGSSKNKDGRNALDVVPLAKWDPYGGLELVSGEATPDDFFVEDDLEPSVWVNRMIKVFGKFVGFPIDSCEKQCIAFFQKLEKV